MTSPLYLNPPFSLETKLKEEIKPQLQLFLSPHDHQASASTSTSTTSSLSNIALATCFNIPHDHKVDNYKSHGDGRSSDGELLFEDGGEFGFDHHEMESSDGSKWMSSKMRLMQKMIIRPNCTATDEAKPLKFTLKFQAPPHDDHDNNINTTSDIMNYSSQSSSSSSNNNNNVRVCADCNTTTTPLWRGGPRGPKSLCNACGIRQRKARRAMALAANGVIESSTKAKAIKDKKSRKSHVWLQCKKQCKPPHDHHQTQKKKNLELSWSKNSTFQKILPQDVEEAAVLLMELSCGFIHT